MTREEAYTESIERLKKNHNLILQLVPGFGKSKLSIDLANHIIASHNLQNVRILLLVSQELHKITWKDEIKKWGGIDADIKAECYNSLFKHEGVKYDIVIADECHHISDDRLDSLSRVKFNFFIGLSGTIPKHRAYKFNQILHPQKVLCDLEVAIESKVLPEPVIAFMPLTLNNTTPSELIEINAKQKGEFIMGNVASIPKYKKLKMKVRILCTPLEYYRYLSNNIDYMKRAADRTHNEILKNKYLKLSGDRLAYLANQKMGIATMILNELKDDRVVTFCKTINQCNMLGKYSICSKNPLSQQFYDDFNEGKINHIMAVNILNENANLVNCKYALFLNLSSSEVVTNQRLGRMLRHPEPVVVVPYFINTREAELIGNMMISKDYVKTINSIKEIKQL